MPKFRLAELFAQGLGVINSAHMEFGPGFNVITGETGAGKTLLLGALELCLGRDGATSRYAVTPTTKALALFIDDDNTEHTLVRESSPLGRLRASIDGVPASAELLRQEAHRMITIHGQHDSLILRQRSEIVRLIDEFGAVDTGVLDEVRREILELSAQRDSFGGSGAERSRELELLAFQLAEFDRIAIRSGHELSDVLEELTHLSAVKDHLEAIVNVLRVFEADDSGLLDQFALAVSVLPSLPQIEVHREALRSALETSRDAISELAAWCDVDTVDLERIERLERRAQELRDLARKYGGSLDDALATHVEVARRFSALEAASDSLASLDERLNHLGQRLEQESRRVLDQRHRGAAALTAAIAVQLARVALGHATVQFEVAGDDGSDARILFRPNPGHVAGPLSAIASGGELSRVLLAVSLVSVDVNQVAVFDEVDAGIGGEVAQQIGDCLREVGDRQQVIAITHLASVAAKAQHHFVVDKVVEDGSTSTVIREVTGEQRISEIARMLVGGSGGEEARALAERMVST